MEVNLAVIGLGYVGLPLAIEFGKIYSTIGFDINEKRIEQLRDGIDSALEVEHALIESSKNLTFSHDINDIALCNVYIVTVPTPANGGKPDLSFLVKASEMLGAVIKEKDIVIFESTVYPGATEEDCIPIIEKISGLKYNVDFFAGYSPERINPGDKERTVANIKKITSGSTPQVADFVDKLYSQIIKAGTHKATSIRVAEAAKVIENVQRDVNIALINEFSMIFNRLGIDTEETLKAAETKWNFLSFRPGLVGGHCIGVDSYYLAHKALENGYYPAMILSARNINEEMSTHVVNELVKKMIKQRMQVNGAHVLLLGFSFKENCVDLRNTKVVDIIDKLKEYDILVDIYDPQVNKEEAKELYAVELIEYPEPAKYDALIVAVAHKEFCAMDTAIIRSWGKEGAILYDLKYTLPKMESDLRL